MLLHAWHQDLGLVILPCDVSDRVSAKPLR
jgi:hypothetical protein